MNHEQELHLILAEILNVNLDAHSTWVQATLSVSDGSLGIHRSTQIVSSAFWHMRLGAITS